MASNVTTNSADVSWTAGGTETEWWFVVNGVHLLLQVQHKL